MLNWFFDKKLETVLEATKTVKIKGVKFRIKKINALNYLDGSKSMLQVFETYRVGKGAQDELTDKKVKEHFSHVLYAGVVSPKLSLKEEPDKILIERLFVDWDMVTKLYEEIMFFTYGKKKVK